MADITDTLKNILGDDAEDKIKNVVDSLQSSEDMDAIGDMGGADSIMQLKSMIEGLTMNRSEPRTNLLLSLKPYMRDTRKQSIDNAVRLLGMINVVKMLNR